MIDPGKHSLDGFLQENTQYRIPEFQRPYVWGREEQWAPLWEDIEAVADRALDTDPSDPKFVGHFLGAVVVKLSSAKTGEATIHEVIDGQQRLTTLLLFLRAFHTVAEELACDKDLLVDVSEILFNRKFRERNTHHQWKLYPSALDSKDFFDVMNCRDRASLRDSRNMGPKAQWSGNKIVDAFLYFHEQIRNWLRRDFSNSEDASVDLRAKALYGAVSRGLRFISIRLDDTDNAQLIFETLNARGTPLLQGELVRNFVLRSLKEIAETGGPVAPDPFAEFDAHSVFWRADVRQGRMHRPRIDLLLYYWMTIRKQDIQLVTSIFSEFQKEMRDNHLKHDLDALKNPSILPVKLESLRSWAFVTEMQTYARLYREFMELEKQANVQVREKQFFRRLEVLDTATVMPVLLLAKRMLGASGAFLDVLCLIESYLVRRVLCGVSPKNLNRFMANLLADLTKTDGDFLGVLRERLQRPGLDDVNRWPDDVELRRNLLTREYYHFLSQSRLRMILEAINQGMKSSKSERMELHDLHDLTIEHVLPQGWRNNPDWSLMEPTREALDARQEWIHRLGNLTLLTEKLNPAVSNGGWNTKRAAFREHSLLKMNQDLVTLDHWDEVAIEARCKSLADLAIRTWPRT